MIIHNNQINVQINIKKLFVKLINVNKQYTPAEAVAAWAAAAAC